MLHAFVFVVEYGHEKENRLDARGGNRRRGAVGRCDDGDRREALFPDSLRADAPSDALWRHHAAGASVREGPHRDPPRRQILHVLQRVQLRQGSRAQGPAEVPYVVVGRHRDEHEPRGLDARGQHRGRGRARDRRMGRPLREEVRRQDPHLRAGTRRPRRRRAQGQGAEHRRSSRRTSGRSTAPSTPRSTAWATG